MNAIDQYVTPAPPRPNPPPAQSSRGPETSGAPTFGDVYNKAANTNQSGNEPASSQKADDDTAQSKEDGKNAAPVGKSGAENETSSTASTSAGSAILALAAELKDKKTGKDADQPADANMAEDPTVAVPKEDGKDKAAAEIQKLIDKAKAAEAQGQSQASAAGSPEQDAAAIALQLLGGEAAANVKDKKALPEETAGKDEPADDKAKDAKADAAGPHADATNVMAAAALVVHAAGGQAKDQQEQGKPKSEDQSAKALAAIGTKTQGATAADETTKTAGAGETVKPETITVLDARRFVGSGEGLSANTQAVMSGVTTDNDWAATMKAASAAANATPEPRTGTPVNTLKIQMTPESLGNVTATLRLHGDQLTVHLQVESGEAFKQLSHDKDGLIQSLKSQGYSVDQVSVQLAPAPSTDRTVAQTSTGQQAGGQMQDGSSAGQFAQQGREQDNNRRQQDNGFNANWQGDDKSVAVDPVAASSDTARSGQVYL